MIGSIFIHSPDGGDLQTLADDFTRLQDFDHVRLAQLITFDFLDRCRQGGRAWCADSPLRVDRDTGYALFRVCPLGLRFVIEQDEAFDPEHHDDLRALRDFALRHNGAAIYELSRYGG